MRVLQPLLCLAGAASVAADSLSSFAYSCQGVFRNVVRDSLSEIDELTKVVDSGEICPAFGGKADNICNQAMERFSQGPDSPNAEGDPEKESLFDEKVDELERNLDMALRLVYLKQLNLLREKALQRYKNAAKGGETTDYQAMVTADQWFKKEAELSTRSSAGWTYAAERTGLQAAMNELAQRNKKATDAQLRAAQQSNAAMQYLQMQQQQLQALQQQLYGGASSPWNFAAAYRIPDSNINLNGQYQQGKGSIQMSCVPDEYGAMLGSQGFTHGVGPGNLGLSVNVNV